jgi:hypothetical protein
MTRVASGLFVGFEGSWRSLTQPLSTQELTVTPAFENPRVIPPYSQQRFIPQRVDTLDDMKSTPSTNLKMSSVWTRPLNGARRLRKNCRANGISASCSKKPERLAASSDGAREAAEEPPEDREAISFAAPGRSCPVSCWAIGCWSAAPTSALAATRWKSRWARAACRSSPGPTRCKSSPCRDRPAARHRRNPEGPGKHALRCAQGTKTP